MEATAKHETHTHDLCQYFLSLCLPSQDFVKPLEMPNQLGGAILNPEEVKEIFYPLPQLAALHDKILVRDIWHVA